MPLVGLLVAASQVPYAARVMAFQTGMSEAGYVEGRNVVIEYRWTYDQNDRLPWLVTDLIDRQVAVIVAGGTRSRLLSSKREIVRTARSRRGIVPSIAWA
jgi:hypothetical protein